MKKLIVGALVGCAMSLAACGGSSSADDTNADVANSVGDSVASLDEMGQGGGFASLMRPVLRAPDFLQPGLGSQLMDLIVPSAQAAACFQDTFTACDNGQRSRTFDGCSLGPATLTGSVQLTFSDATCAMGASGDSVTRNANFTLSGPNGGNIQVSSTDGGQKVTRTDTGFTYEVLGMHRVGTDANGKVRFDVQSSTRSPIGFTGTSRHDRVLNGGTLVVQHNLAGFTATLTPSNVTWDGTCNCPVSGSWSGTLSGSRTGNYTMDITGCGTATITGEDGQTKNVTMDRCVAL